MIASRDFRETNDLVPQFIVACCESEPSSEVQSSLLYYPIQEWCGRTRHDVMRQRKFAEELERLNYVKRI